MAPAPNCPRNVPLEPELELELEPEPKLELELELEPGLELELELEPGLELELEPGLEPETGKRPERMEPVKRCADAWRGAAPTRDAPEPAPDQVPGAARWSRDG